MPTMFLKMKSKPLHVYEQKLKIDVKRSSQVIVDAERNRRTLEKLANQLPWFEGGAGSNSAKRVPKTIPNVTNKLPKWEPKSL